MIIIIIAYMIIIIVNVVVGVLFLYARVSFSLADPFDRIENSAVCLVSYAVEAFSMGIGVDAIITYYCYIHIIIITSTSMDGCNAIILWNFGIYFTVKLVVNHCECVANAKERRK